jgi:hypothetical protein
MDTFNAILNWFYAPKSSVVVALYRIALGITLLLTILLWRGHIVQFYSDSGYVTGDFVRNLSRPFSFSLLYYGSGPGLAYFLYAVLLVSCLCFIFGIYSRFFGFLCYVLYLSFFNRFPLTAFDGSQIIIIALFFTLFLQTDRALTPSWYQRRQGSSDTVPGWPVRMIQIQLVIIYFFAAVSKVQSPSWLNGTELLGILNFQYATFNFSWLVNHPYIVNFLTYGTIATEFAAAFWLWTKASRPWVLFAVICMHLGILIAMQVTYFSEVMISCVILFAEPEDIRHVVSSGKKFFRLLPLKKLFSELS